MSSEGTLLSVLEASFNFWHVRSFVSVRMWLWLMLHWLSSDLSPLCKEHHLPYLSIHISFHLCPAFPLTFGVKWVLDYFVINTACFSLTWTDKFMTQLSKPVLGPAFFDSEMLQEHVVQGVLSPSGTGHSSDWCSWLIFAFFDAALKFEFTGQQNVPNSLCWEIGKHSLFRK